MESSEDDAGTATSASRRAAAREKDNEQAENTNATSSSQQTSEARTSYETPAMSEENFDGDSVPSPSTHDVNTSTEAILDMIDEIVDGPGAPKRLPLSLDIVAECATTSDHPILPQLPKANAEDDLPQQPPASSATSAKSEQEPQDSTDETPAECTSRSDGVVLKPVCTESPQTSTSVAERIVIAESTLADECAVISGKSEISNDWPPLNIPSSSVVETVHSISDISECQIQDRTVKCVTSSDTRDNVVVESAESTSNDSSTADVKIAVVESVTRSPLRRRLVRPTLSDRRPDSTVSSTVDVPTTEQSNSEHVTKYVSSSSDAVPAVHGNVKPEEISNLSEISVCKAETSVSPPKKIKLIRQRITPVASSLDTVQDKEILLPELGQCQSTSQDTSMSMLSESCSEFSTAGTSTTQDVEMKSDLKKEIVMNDTFMEVPALNECVSRPKQSGDLENSVIATRIPNKALSSANIIESAHENEVSLVKLDSSKSSIPEASAPVVNTQAECTQSSSSKCDDTAQDQSECIKQIPKLTIKLSNKQSEEIKSPVPKLTIKPLKPPAEEVLKDSCEQIPNVTKINIKPIVKPIELIDVPTKKSNERDNRKDDENQIPLVTKINIKPILKPPEKINDVHRKSSSSEISESEYSENDESTSTSDQASASDQGSSNIIPKVTIKLGKPGTQSEGKFYTEKNIPKITIKGIQPNEKEETEKNIPKLIIKGIQHSEKEELEKNIPKFKIKGIQHSAEDDQESMSKLKLIINQTEDKQFEKIPKLTIKTVAKSEGQPLSPKLTIKPLKPPDSVTKDAVVDCSDSQHIPKLKITTESLSSTAELKDAHVPKITIKPVTRTDVDTKIPKKSAVVCDSSEHIPVVTKLTIKPILKPTDSGETSEGLEDKVPVVSKLNIKPVVKPKDNEVDSSVEDIPKITKLNIKPIKNPEGNSSEEKDCDELNADVENSIPVVTKINIKPTVKRQTEVTKDSENQSSETGNSSDDNIDIPVVTKLNIKPVIKPIEDVKQKTSNDDTIPTVTKLTIKSVVKPDENMSPSSPKRDGSKSTDSKITAIPVVTKLNIKPIVKPENIDHHKLKCEDKLVKNPPLLMKINRKAVADTSNESLSADKKVNNIDDNSEHIFNNISEESSLASEPDAKIILKSSENDETERISSEKSELDRVSLKEDSIDLVSVKQTTDAGTHLDTSNRQNCVPKVTEKRDSLPSLKEGQGKTASDLDVLGRSCSSLQTALEKVESEDIKISSTPDLNEMSHSSGKLDINVTNVKTSVDSNTASSAADSSAIRQLSKQQMSSVKNCTLLKKLLETTDDGLDKRLDEPTVKSNCSPSILSCKDAVNCEPVDTSIDKINSDSSYDNNAQKVSQSPDTNLDSSIIEGAVKIRPIQEICKEASENLKHPLEINVSEKIVNQSSGQDSPRIILKINKTDHGSSAKIITEEIHKSDTLQQPDCSSDNTQEIVNDKQSPKKNLVNSRRKPTPNVTINPSVTMGKRLRSSRIVENTDKSPVVKRNVGKRPSTADDSPLPSKEPELSTLETKRLKLGQLLSNKSLTITPIVTKVSQTPPVNKPVDNKQGKTINHALLNNENCSKNGNSKLHNILSNLQAKQMQAITLNDINCSDKSQTGTSEVDSNISSGSGDTVEIVKVENCRPEVQEMMISENCEFRDFSMAADDVSQDPLEVDSSKTTSEGTNDSLIIPKTVESTPQPKKRGRPRKLPLSEGSKPAPVALPVPALDERPQRSLRLYRDRPAIIARPRGGRGRGRGARRVAAEPEPQPEPEPVPIVIEVAVPEPAADALDPTSSRIKLPRMTEALDKMPASCSTPLSTRRRSSAELKLFGEPVEAVAPEPSPETPVLRGRGRGGRGRARGGRAALRTPRARGRGRGGGRGAMYMKETLGIYGRVCGPATTTVQLFEEETCMMDDNATPAKPSHLLDEDSQSSVKSSTNESSKLKKSKFADLFDSNKVWTAADVKEYTWPCDKSSQESQVMMIQEQVAMFLSVKSFKRRYPELKRRTIVGEERDHVLSKGIVTEALCDLGITAVDASEVLDIMLSDYPHKYEEYRSHQRERQLTAPEEPEVKPEVKTEKGEVKSDSKPAEIKPEPPKVDPEKTRQDMARAAIASASEWNARLNAMRRPACVDLQTMTVQRRRAAASAPASASAPAAAAPPPPLHVRPPAGFYPHALLPGQYHHTYRCYTPDQLRYFPLNTALAAPPAPPSPAASSSDSEAECGSRSDDSSRGEDMPSHQKRKRLTKTKRMSQAEVLNIKKEEKDKEESRDGDVDTCHVCNLRLEANRKYTHERFLVCANCNAKLHPGCVELSADTIRKCREYAWQCAECKSCCACRRPQDDDKMLFCDLCDRGFHIYCVGLDKVPSGRWHCVECAICKSCGARSPGGPPPGAGGGGVATPGPAPTTPGSTPATPGPSPAATPSGSVTLDTPGAAQWHHQTRRGPGGHKVYSHSLCTPCARAYRIGRYCPLCDRSFIGPKGTMQLVICKLCDRQLHQECVRATVSVLNVLDYTCGECRRGGITSRAAAVRLAPRTVATLFMAKRRFNKYAHRQYLASRLRAKAADDDASNDADVDVDADAEVSDLDAGDAGDPLEGAGEPPPDADVD